MSCADLAAEVAFVPNERQTANGVDDRWNLSSSAGSSKETTTGRRRRMLDEWFDLARWWWSFGRGFGGGVLPDLNTNAVNYTRCTHRTMYCMVTLLDILSE